MPKNFSRNPVIVIVLVTILAVTAFGFDFTKLENRISERTLANGLEVIVMERHDAPVVSFVTWVDVGGANDPKGYTGLAHMFEHMAFKGTKSIGSKDIRAELAEISVEDSIYMKLRREELKGTQADSSKMAKLQAEFNSARDSAYQFVIPNEYSQIVEREGGVDLNAGTSMDFTMYHISYPSNKAELWMAMESDRFTDPVLREMYKERDVIAEERRESLESSPFRRLLDELLAAAYKAHPYGNPIVGHASDIQNFTRQAALAYFKKYYVPSNMVIAIVGDEKSDVMFNMADKYFGKLPASPKPEGVITVEPEQKAERRIYMEDPAQPLFLAAFHIPSETDSDWLAIEALADYYGQGRTSLLYKKLVKEKKIAAQVGVYAGYPASKYPSLFLIYVIPTPGSSLEEIEDDVFSELDKIKTESIPQEELEKIRARAKADFIFGLESNIGMAMQLAAYQTYFGDWHEMFKQLDKINAVTPDDIQRVANEYFIRQNSTIAVMKTTGE